MSTRSLMMLAALVIAALLLGGLAGCTQTPAPVPTATVAVATTAPAPTTPATVKPAATTAAATSAATTAAVAPAAGTPAAGATTSAISPAAGTPAAGATASAATIAQGQQLFQANCARCHGPDAEGGIVVGSATSARIRAPDLDNLYHGDVNLIRRAILDGKDQDGEDLDPAMPRWRGTLNDTQVNAIVAYLLTLKD